MKVLLTGATGFLGGHLLQALLAQGARVRCLVRQSSPRRNLEGLSVEVVMGDLRDAASIRRAVEGCVQVYHCAADYRLFSRRPEELYQSNVEGTRNVLRAAAAARVERMVYTSSVGALGLRADGAAADETTPVSLPDMVGHYKRSKYLAERVAEEWAARGLPVVIVNPSTPVGEGDVKPTATGKMILDFLNRRTPAYVDTGLNLIDVRDVARGHLLAAEKGRVGEKYILGNRNMTLREIFDTLACLTGLKPPRLKLPHWIPLLYAAADTALARLGRREPGVPLEAVKLSRHKMFFDASKAVRELGLPQTPVEEPLLRAVRWFEENGYVRLRSHAVGGKPA
ncbi:MAG: hopanoid-associated sugar epimerase [Thermoanaerobaculia bacterium]